jgi:hypothetical protein
LSEEQEAEAALEAEHLEFDEDDAAPAPAMPSGGPVRWQETTATVDTDVLATAGVQDVKAKLNLNGGLRAGEATLLDVFLAFTPMTEVDAAVRIVDDKGRAKYGSDWPGMTHGFMLQWWGVWFEMLAHPRSGDRRAYWRSTYESNQKSFYNYSDIMPLSHFEMAYTVFELPSYAAQPGSAPEPFATVRQWVDGCNRVWNTALTPGTFLIVDESMIFWSGRGMPGWIVIPRKPKATGMEGKTTCCGETNIILHFDMQEGKHRMGPKDFNDTHQRSTGCTLRCVKPWFGSGGAQGVVRRHARRDFCFQGHNRRRRGRRRRVHLLRRAQREEAALPHRHVQYDVAGSNPELHRVHAGQRRQGDQLRRALHLVAGALPVPRPLQRGGSAQPGSAR